MNILKNLLSSHVGITGCAVVSMEGLPIVSLFPNELDEMTGSALIATILSLGERVIMTISEGYLEEVIIKGTKGYAITAVVNDGCVLFVTMKNNVKLGWILYQCRRTCKEIKRVME